MAFRQQAARLSVCGLRKDGEFVSFRDWLQKQKERQDNIGKLARALADKELKFRSRRRKPDEHRKWASTVTWYGTMAHVRAFNKAWREYLKAKANAEKATAD